MKKQEIVHLSLVILGISIFIRALITLIDQVGFYYAFSENISRDFIWLIVQAVGLSIVVYASWYLVFKSSNFAEKIFKGDENESTGWNYSKLEIIHIAVIIMSLYFLVKLFPSFVSAVYSVFMGFFDKYTGDHYPEHLWIIILYASLIFVLRHSRRFTDWLIQKVLSEGESAGGQDEN
jgi:hypothetical protein